MSESEAKMHSTLLQFYPHAASPTLHGRSGKSKHKISSVDNKHSRSLPWRVCCVCLCLSTFSRDGKSERFYLYFASSHFRGCFLFGKWLTYFVMCECVFSSLHWIHQSPLQCWSTSTLFQRLWEVERVRSMKCTRVRFHVTLSEIHSGPFSRVGMTFSA